MQKVKNKYRGVEQLVARQAHNLEVACSSRVSATILKRCKALFLTPLLLCIRFASNAKIRICKLHGKLHFLFSGRVAYVWCFSCLSYVVALYVACGNIACRVQRTYISSVTWWKTRTRGQGLSFWGAENVSLVCVVSSVTGESRWGRGSFCALLLPMVVVLGPGRVSWESGLL